MVGLGRKANRGRSGSGVIAMFKQFFPRATAVPSLMGRVRAVRGMMSLSLQTPMAPVMQSARMFPSPEKIGAGACQIRNFNQWLSARISPFNASARGNLVVSFSARGFASKKHKRVIKQSKGFRGRANRCFRIAIRRLEKSWQYAYRDRKVKKREFRKLWIQRLNAGVRQQGLSYSRFINMQAQSGVVLDRKILSSLAMNEPFSFKAVVDVVKMHPS